MTLKTIFLAGVVLAAPFVLPHTAQAGHGGDYCREYTKSIRVGGRLESGYGQACRQPDGSWLIVSLQGNIDPFEKLYRSAREVNWAPEIQYRNHRHRYYQPVEYHYPCPIHDRHRPPGHAYGHDWKRDWHDRHDDHNDDRHHDRRRRRD